jgi:hypothetical protein
MVEIGANVADIASQADSCIRAMAPFFVLQEDQLRSFIPETRLNEEEETAAMLILDQSIIGGRSLSITENQRNCNCMHEAKKGDMIVVFEGADRLYVLRPINKTHQRYRLVGGAYVEGLMNGEAYRELDPDVVDRDIELV